jgi:hypothetical protein
MAIQEQQMQQNAMARKRQDIAYQREEDQRIAGIEATRLGYAGDVAGAEKKYGAGVGNAEIHKLLSGITAEQRAAVKARYEAAVPVVIQALKMPSREARVAAIQQASPYLTKFGWSAEELTNFDPTDDNLKVVINNAREFSKTLDMYDKQNEDYTLPPGSKRFRGREEIASVAATPPQGEVAVYNVNGEDILVRVVDGVATPVQLGGAGAGAGAGAGGGMGNGVGGGGGGNVFGRMVGVESRGKQFGRDGKPLTSPKGAIGVAQVMPGTAREAAKLAGVPFDNNRYRTDRAYNYALGEAYYNEQLRVFGDESLAAAAYNAGPGAVRRALQRGGPNGWINHVPPETREYVRNVFSSNAASGGGGGGGGGGRDVIGPASKEKGAPTAAEQSSSYNIARALRAAKIIKTATANNPSANAPGALEAFVGSVPLVSGAVNFTRDADRQIVSAAQRDLLDALLYLSTGAAYNKEQLQGQIESYLPEYSDQPAAIESKRVRLRQLVADAKVRAGRAWTPELQTALDEFTQNKPSKAKTGNSNYRTLTPEQARNAPKGTMYRTTDGRVMER